jgi:hypothetical protein
VLRQFFHRILDSAARRTGLDALAQIAIDQELRQIRAEVAARTPANPMLHGFKVYSQIDEDGIIERLFEAIGTRSRVFVEVGSGSGVENNTHYLLHKGWRGMWIEGDAPQLHRLRSLFTTDPVNGDGRGHGDVDLCVFQGYISPDTIDRVLASARSTSSPWISTGMTSPCWTRSTACARA